ncbi:MAG: TlpA disulfide reductase family protein [Hyphomicrobiaceae bacterium]
MPASLGPVRRHFGALILGGALLLSSPLPLRADELEIWRPSTVPAFNLPTLDGAMEHLGAGAGRLTIVHFFATWCEPCRDELKSLERLAVALGARRLRILAVDVGEPGDRVRRFLERHKISLRFPVLLDVEKQAMRAWAVEMLPTSYVLDGAFCPLWKVAGALDWDVGAALAGLKAELARLEQGAGRGSEQDCIVKGGNQ